MQSPSPFTAKYENKNLLGFMYPRNVFHKNDQPAFLVLTRTPGCFCSSSEFSFEESRKAKSLGRLEQLLRALVLGQGTKASSGKAYPKLLVRTLMSHKLTTSTRKRKKKLFAKLLVEPNLQRYRVSQKINTLLEKKPSWTLTCINNSIDVKCQRHFLS